MTPTASIVWTALIVMGMGGLAVGAVMIALTGGLSGHVLLAMATLIIAGGAGLIWWVWGIAR